MKATRRPPPILVYIILPAVVIATGGGGEVATRAGAALVDKSRQLYHAAVSRALSRG